MVEPVSEMAEAFSPLPGSDACRRIVEILKPCDVRRIAPFCSRARGDHRPGSDLDLVVRFERAPSLLRLGELEERLGEPLGMRVDLFTERSLKPYIRDTVLREARVTMDDKSELQLLDACATLVEIRGRAGSASGLEALPVERAAAERLLTEIGEAAKNVSPGFRPLLTRGRVPPPSDSESQRRVR